MDSRPTLQRLRAVFAATTARRLFIIFRHKVLHNFRSIFNRFTVSEVLLVLYALSQL